MVMDMLFDSIKKSMILCNGMYGCNFNCRTGGTSKNDLIQLQIFSSFFHDTYTQIYAHDFARQTENFPPRSIVRASN